MVLWYSRCSNRAVPALLVLQSGGHGPRAAGGTWTCLLANTPWPARYGHTTVIDAAGTIYLMGGAFVRGGGAGAHLNLYNDVWVGTNNGANSTQGHSQSTHGVLKGYLYRRCILRVTRFCNCRMGTRAHAPARAHTHTHARTHAHTHAHTWFHVDLCIVYKSYSSTYRCSHTERYRYA